MGEPGDDYRGFAARFCRFAPRTAEADSAGLQSPPPIATGKAGKDDRKLRKRRLPWLNSFLRKSLRGQADLPSPPDLVPPHLRYQDRISKSEAAERFDFLLSQAGHSEESVQS